MTKCPDKCLLKSSHHFKRNGKATLGKSPCIIKCFLILKNYLFICSCASWPVGLQSPTRDRTLSLCRSTHRHGSSLSREAVLTRRTGASAVRSTPPGGGWRRPVCGPQRGPPAGPLYSEDMQSSPTQGNAPVKTGNFPVRPKRFCASIKELSTDSRTLGFLMS